MNQGLEGLGIWGKMDIKIPKSIQYITGDQHKGHHQIINFFKSIIKENNLPNPSYPYIEKRTRYLWGNETNGCPLPQGAYSDEKVHMLLLMQAVIASVMETRTLSNFVQFDFFYNKETLETKIEEMKEFEEGRRK